MTRFPLFTALLVSATLAPARADDCSTGGEDIISTAVAAGEFQTLAAALKSAGLVEALQGKGPFTVFAPTDAAFAKLPEGTVKSLLEPRNKDKLTAILTYHVVAGRVAAKDVVKLKGAKTLNGQKISIVAKSNGVRVNSARVVKTDIACSNGIIHVIDSVILPESRDIVEVASDAGTFQTLLAAAKAAGLVGTLKGKGPLTVFAPNDAAFAKLPEGTIASLLKPENKDKLAQILAFHVVSGRIHSEDALAAGSAQTVAELPVRIRKQDGGAFVENARILSVDLDASNGVIHVIDTVLIPRAG